MLIKMPWMLRHLSTKARSVISPTQGRRCDSQATDNQNDVNKKEVDGKNERVKTKVDLEEQQAELGDNADEDEELSEARDEYRDDQREQVAAVSVPRRHGAVAVPRAGGEESQVQMRSGEQRDDRVAGTHDGGRRYIVVGDGGGFGGRSNISTCWTMKGEKAETN